jgi:hypothetical protein
MQRYVILLQKCIKEACTSTCVGKNLAISDSTSYIIAHTLQLILENRGYFTAINIIVPALLYIC